MDVRRRTEEIEHLTFAPWATFSDASRSRAVPEPQDPLRPVFQRDRDRVLHCKAFRRLKQKTQVFLSPEGDLYRTRLTHTLEVSQIARTIARGLRLNEDLTEAISLAHDLGHTPFGHAGEKALNDLCPDGFHHYMQSLRVVDRLEKDGEGLNLTWEVRNGIVTHTKGTWAATPEGRIVRLADQIAFVNHDIEDAVRAGVPVLGGNLPRAQMKQTMSQSRYDSHLPASGWQLQLDAIKDGHCGLLPESQFAPMARIQLARDESMAKVTATAVQQWSRPGQSVLLVAGRSHVRSDIGVPTWLPKDLRQKVAIAQSDKAPTAISMKADKLLTLAGNASQDQCAQLREQWKSRPAPQTPAN